MRSVNDGPFIMIGDDSLDYDKEMCAIVCSLQDAGTEHQSEYSVR